MNNSQEERDIRRREYMALFIIIVVLFPLLVTVTVGGYGFAIWMMQLVLGPPGHTMG